MLINAHQANPTWKIPNHCCVLFAFEVDSEPMPAGDRGPAVGYHADLTQPPLCSICDHARSRSPVPN